MDKSKNQPVHISAEGNLKTKTVCPALLLLVDDTRLHTTQVSSQSILGKMDTCLNICVDIMSGTVHENRRTDCVCLCTLGSSASDVFPAFVIGQEDGEGAEPAWWG